MVRGVRRRRTRAGGAALVVVLIGVGGVVATSSGVGVAVIRSLPAGALITLADAGNGVAFDELSMRLDRGELDAAAAGRLVDVALAHQADRARPFDPKWSELIERVRSVHGMSDERLTAYARNAVIFEVFVREQVRATEFVPVVLGYQTDRLAPAPRGALTYDPLVLEVECARLSVGSVSKREGIIHTSAFTLYGNGGGSSTMNHPLDRAPGPEVTRLDVAFRVRVFEHSEARDRGEVAGEWELRRVADVEVVAADAAGLPVVEDASARAEVVGSVYLSRLEILDHAPEEEWDEAIVVPVWSGVRETPVSWRVEALLPDGSRVPCGSVVLGATPDGMLSTRAYQSRIRLEQAGVAMPHEFDWPERVDVVMTPDPEWAYSSVRIRHIVGGEFVFRGVPVVRRASFDRSQVGPDTPIHAEP